MNAFGTYTDVEIARVCHEANRALQAVHATTAAAQINPVEVAIPVAPPWENLPPDERDSVVEGVRNIRTGLVTSPESSHANWCAYKAAHGWTWGPTKDPICRTHPNLVPYHALPAAQRDKDTVFFTLVDTLLRTRQRL